MLFSHKKTMATGGKVDLAAVYPLDPGQVFIVLQPGNTVLSLHAIPKQVRALAQNYDYNAWKRVEAQIKEFLSSSFVQDHPRSRSILAMCYSLYSDLYSLRSMNASNPNSKKMLMSNAVDWMKKAHELFPLFATYAMKIASRTIRLGELHRMYPIKDDGRQRSHVSNYKSLAVDAADMFLLILNKEPLSEEDQLAKFDPTCHVSDVQWNDAFTHYFQIVMIESHLDQSYRDRATAIIAKLGDGILKFNMVCFKLLAEWDRPSLEFLRSGLTVSREQLSTPAYKYQSSLKDGKDDYLLFVLKCLCLGDKTVIIDMAIKAFYTQKVADLAKAGDSTTAALTDTFFSSLVEAAITFGLDFNMLRERLESVALSTEFKTVDAQYFFTSFQTALLDADVRRYRSEDTDALELQVLKVAKVLNPRVAGEGPSRVALRFAQLRITTLVGNDYSLGDMWDGLMDCLPEDSRVSFQSRFDVSVSGSEVSQELKRLIYDFFVCEARRCFYGGDSLGSVVAFCFAGKFAVDHAVDLTEETDGDEQGHDLSVENDLIAAATQEALSSFNLGWLPAEIADPWDDHMVDLADGISKELVADISVAEQEFSRELAGFEMIVGYMLAGISFDRAALAKFCSELYQCLSDKFNSIQVQPLSIYFKCRLDVLGCVLKILNNDSSAARNVSELKVRIEALEDPVKATWDAKGDACDFLMDWKDRSIRLLDWMLAYFDSAIGDSYQFLGTRVFPLFDWQGTTVSVDVDPNFPKTDMVKLTKDLELKLGSKGQTDLTGSYMALAIHGLLGYFYFYQGLNALREGYNFEQQGCQSGTVNAKPFFEKANIHFKAGVFPDAMRFVPSFVVSTSHSAFVELCGNYCNALDDGTPFVGEDVVQGSPSMPILET